MFLVNNPVILFATVSYCIDGWHRHHPSICGSHPEERGESELYDYNGTLGYNEFGGAALLTLDTAGTPVTNPQADAEGLGKALLEDLQ